MTEGRLTDEAHWDEYWEHQIRQLPVEITHTSVGFQANAILDVFDAWLPSHPGAKVLEVGGSPGQYLVYVHRQTGCECSVLDFSPVGCGLARKNFSMLDIPVAVHEHDMFDP